MKKGKKSKLTLMVSLMLALVFAGSVAVAAAGPGLNWTPDPAFAGGNQGSPVVRPDGIVFQGVKLKLPDDMEFHFTTGPYYHWTADPGQPGQSSWGPADNLEGYDNYLDLNLTKSQLEATQATDPEAQLAFNWSIQYDPDKSPYEARQSEAPGDLSFGFPIPTEAEVKVHADFVWKLPEKAPGDKQDPPERTLESDVISTTVPVGKGQPAVWGEMKAKLEDNTDFTFIPMNDLALVVGDTTVKSPYAYGDPEGRIDFGYDRMQAGAYVCTYYSLAGQSDRSVPENFAAVTVYVKDADGKRVDLGSKMFTAVPLNLFGGRTDSAAPQAALNVVPWNEPCDAPTIANDTPALKGTPNLSRLKPGVYTLMADLAANGYNEASAGNEIGSVTVVGITEVSVDPASSSVERGTARQFTANVKAPETDNAKIKNKTVTWSISGQKSADTEIDPQTGVLTVGFGEPAGNAITVTAESVFDNNGLGRVRGEATATVVEPDHSVTNGTSEIKRGQDGNWEFAGKFANLSSLSLNGTDFTIVPESATKAQLKYPGYNGVAGIAEEGSVKVTLYKEFLATLPAGEYKLEATFDDGGVRNIGSAQFTIAAGAQPAKAPRTGDETGVWPWIVLAAAAAAGIAWFAYRNKKAEASE